MANRMKKIWILMPFIIVTGLGSLLSGCASKDKNSDTPDGAFAIAEEYDKDERYEVALQKYQDVKNKFPYSQYALKAELAIADVYYKQESYPEAQLAYQTFRDLHPKHPQIDYVVYKIAMSFYQQVPESIDRDLSTAKEAITNFKEIQEKFTSSTHVKESEDKRLELLKKLAAKEEYIASFYMKREQWASALRRWEGLLAQYPKLGYDETALSKAAISAQKSGDGKKARDFILQLEKNYPDSHGLDQARKALQ